MQGISAFTDYKKNESKGFLHKERYRVSITTFSVALKSAVVNEIRRRIARRGALYSELLVPIFLRCNAGRERETKKRMAGLTRNADGELAAGTVAGSVGRRVRDDVLAEREKRSGLLFTMRDDDPTGGHKRKKKTVNTRESLIRVMLKWAPSHCVTRQ